MVASELRAKAREALQGKWGKAALLALCYGLITFVINFVIGLIPIIGSLITFVISLPISFGILVSFMKLKRDEDITYTDFLNIGFSNFGKIWGVFGNMVLKMIIPIVLVVIFLIIFTVGIGGSAASHMVTTYSSHSYAGMTAGFGGVAIVGLIGYFVSLIYAVIKGYLYSLSYYVLYDNPDKSGKEIVEISESLMRGNRWRFFWLGLTFIGWSILCTFTLGIGLLWLMPYIMVSFVCFYEDLAGNSTSQKVETDNPVEE
jgi:uncharacterized membrane protein